MLICCVTCPVRTFAPEKLNIEKLRFEFEGKYTLIKSFAGVG